MHKDVKLLIFIFIMFFIGEPNYPKTSFEFQQRKKGTVRIIYSPDLNKDRTVNLFDLAILADKWLEEI